MNAIEVHGVSKRYLLGERAPYGTLRETLSSFGRGRATRREFWALRDIDLEVAEGEVLGLIGRNGAGKSTLLKIISRITEPTTGVARTRGRVGSLLEVGTGFSPELTGRENVFLNGAILGMTRQTIRERFDEIVWFAGVEDFIDTPLKRFSSGMQMRLAFSIAAHLRTDIVVVDEVLAVGDAEFQRRCLGKMSDLGSAGRTVVFVSHDMSAIGRLCSRVVWLERGMVHADGAAGEVIRRYTEEGVDDVAETTFASVDGSPVRLIRAALLDERGATARDPVRGDPLTFELRFEMLERVPGVDLAFALIAQNGTVVVNEDWSDRREDRPFDDSGEHTVRFQVPGLLPPGDYTLRLWLGTNHEDLLWKELLRFRLAPRPGDRQDWLERPRMVQPDVSWDASR